jgi:hypothetical protein
MDEFGAGQQPQRDDSHPQLDPAESALSVTPSTQQPNSSNSQHSSSANFLAVELSEQHPNSLSLQ